MDTMIDSNNLYSDYLNAATNASSKANQLTDTLTGGKLGSSSDEELMEVCKSFESYFVEQVLKEMEKTVHSSDQDSQYYQYFGDILTQSYAEQITESGQLGLAQTLYESMKRNMQNTV